MNQCYDNIRFSLSDLSGQMRFEAFDIVDMRECRDVAVRLRKYLVRRPLAQVDVQRIQSMECADDCTCLPEVARVVREQQRTFGPRPRPTGAAAFGENADGDSSSPVPCEPHPPVESRIDRTSE